MITAPLLFVSQRRRANFGAGSRCGTSQAMDSIQGLRAIAAVQNEKQHIPGFDVVR